MSFSTKIRRVFLEPRSVMRILQVVLAAWAFMACIGFTVTVYASCVNDQDGGVISVSYPFGIDDRLCPPNKNDYLKLDGRIHINSLLGAQIFVVIASFAFLYALFILVVYMYLDEVYKSKSMFSIVDFGITGIMCFFWINGTLTFNSDANALQDILSPEIFLQYVCRDDCRTHSTSFTELNFTLLLGLFNAFLWAANLWFVFKETRWFQNRGQTAIKSIVMEQQHA